MHDVMTPTNDESQTRGWLRRIPSLIIATTYVVVALRLVSTRMWGTTAMGVRLLAMAYVRFELTRSRVNRPAEWDSESEIVHAAAVTIVCQSTNT